MNNFWSSNVMTTLLAAMAAVILSAASATHAQQAVQWRVQDGGNGHWYQLQAAALSRDEASAAARARGAELASVTTQSENELLVALASGNACWIGGDQPAGACEPGCAWSWLDGEPWSFTRWDPGTAEPNDGGGGTPGEQGLEFRPSGLWNDYWVWRTLPSLIEWSADCNNDGVVDYGQILDGTLPDGNSNGVPDCCESGGSCCVGDILADRVINGADLGALLAYWGPVTSSPISRSCDLNGDNVVNGADIGLLLAGWGNCP